MNNALKFGIYMNEICFLIIIRKSEFAHDVMLLIRCGYHVFPLYIMQLTRTKGWHISAM